MGKRRTGQAIHGILLLDKRPGVSSNRALQEAKRLFNAAKAGHTGSLDPLATGLLPICFGAATRISAMMLDDNKRYQTIIQLGIKTDTGDLEGNIIERQPIPDLNRDKINAVLEKFIGPQKQIPPMYSALKQGGKKLYELARNGETVTREARQITVYEITLIHFEENLLTLDVYCSKGTYIRTLAEDIGHALGSCATVNTLRRTAVGGFTIEQSVTLGHLQSLDEESLKSLLLAVDIPLQDMPAVQLNHEQSIHIQQGQLLSLAEHPASTITGAVRIYHENAFLGLGEMRMDGKLAPKKIFNLNG